MWLRGILLVIVASLLPTLHGQLSLDDEPGRPDARFPGPLQDKQPGHRQRFHKQPPRGQAQYAERSRYKLHKPSRQFDHNMGPNKGKTTNWVAMLKLREPYDSTLRPRYKVKYMPMRLLDTPSPHHHGDGPQTAMTQAIVRPAWVNLDSDKVRDFKKKDEKVRDFTGKKVGNRDEENEDIFTTTVSPPSNLNDFDGRIELHDILMPPKHDAISEYASYGVKLTSPRPPKKRRNGPQQSASNNVLSVKPYRRFPKQVKYLTLVSKPGMESEHLPALLYENGLLHPLKPTMNGKHNMPFSYHQQGRYPLQFHSEVKHFGNHYIPIRGHGQQVAQNANVNTVTTQASPLANNDGWIPINTNRAPIIKHYHVDSTAHPPNLGPAQEQQHAAQEQQHTAQQQHHAAQLTQIQQIQNHHQQQQQIQIQQQIQNHAAHVLQQQQTQESRPTQSNDEAIRAKQAELKEHYKNVLAQMKQAGLEIIPSTVHEIKTIEVSHGPSNSAQVSAQINVHSQNDILKHAAQNQVQTTAHPFAAAQNQVSPNAHTFSNNNNQQQQSVTTPHPFVVQKQNAHAQTLVSTTAQPINIGQNYVDENGQNFIQPTAHTHTHSYTTPTSSVYFASNTKGPGVGNYAYKLNHADGGYGRKLPTSDYQYHEQNEYSPQSSSSAESSAAPTRRSSTDFAPWYEDFYGGWPQFRDNVEYHDYDSTRLENPAMLKPSPSSNGPPYNIRNHKVPRPPLNKPTSRPFSHRPQIAAATEVTKPPKYRPTVTVRVSRPMHYSNEPNDLKPYNNDVNENNSNERPQIADIEEPPKNRPMTINVRGSRPLHFTTDTKPYNNVNNESTESSNERPDTVEPPKYRPMTVNIRGSIPIRYTTESKPNNNENSGPPNPRPEVTFSVHSSQSAETTGILNNSPPEPTAVYRPSNRPPSGIVHSGTSRVYNFNKHNIPTQKPSESYRSRYVITAVSGKVLKQQSKPIHQDHIPAHRPSTSSSEEDDGPIIVYPVNSTTDPFKYSHVTPATLSGVRFTRGKPYSFQVEPHDTEHAHNSNTHAQNKKPAIPTQRNNERVSELDIVRSHEMEMHHEITHYYAPVREDARFY